jgi:hypothetical protein
MIHYSGTNDILRLQTTTARDGVDFNLAYIDPGFTVPHTENFDQQYMRALFDHGFELARRGYPWSKGHPGLRSPSRVRETAGEPATGVGRRPAPGQRASAPGQPDGT